MIAAARMAARDKERIVQYARAGVAWAILATGVGFWVAVWKVLTWWL